MALIGLRDMSLIETAPRDRLPVQTQILPFDEETIVEAILRNTSLFLLRRNLARDANNQARDGRYIFVSGPGYGWKQWVSDGFYTALGLDDPEKTIEANRAVFWTRMDYEDNAQYYLIWAVLMKRAGGTTNEALVRKAYDFIRRHEKGGLYLPPPLPGSPNPRGWKTYHDVLWWRSVGHTQNGYATEACFDEVARAAGRDPFELRRELLSDHPRHRGVLELAAEKAGWGRPLPAGRARGVAVHASFSSFVAQVAEVSLDEGGMPRVHRVVCAVDCGIAINPDNVRAQMEGGIGFGLGTVLHDEVTLEAGRVVQSNFHDYPMLRIQEMPEVEVHIVPSTEAPTGVGEPGVPPIGPAVVSWCANWKTRSLILFWGFPARWC